MSELKVEVKPVEVDYGCDQCGKGMMRPTGIALLSNPVKYPHKCSICGYEMIFLVKYPSVRFERICEGE